MINEFDAFIQRHQLFTKDDKILIAISGGRDSVVLLDLLCKTGYNVALAHCNFQLRGEDSDHDEVFVEQLAQQYKVPCYTKRFETTDYASEQQVSIQMAARDLRYSWFDELRQKKNFKWIATAHHQDDHIETVLINMLRGTGISGLHGILPKRDHIVRPILFASRDQVDHYVEEQNLEYREDQTNASVKYLRNKLRHEVVPKLKEINPELGNTFWQNSQRIQSAERIMQQKVQEVRDDVMSVNGDLTIINISKLNKQSAKADYLFELLSPFGFSVNQIENIQNLSPEVSGKSFYTDQYVLLVNRGEYQLQKIGVENQQTYYIQEKTEYVNDPIKLKIRKQPFGDKFVISTEPHKVMLDADKLKYPLVLRKWKEGDDFQPLGMKGKKLLSDFFIDQKFSVFEKKNTWILESDEQIVWIVGHRIDDRFKLTKKTKQVWVIEIDNLK